MLTDGPEFTNTIEYIDPLIREVLKRFALTPAQYHELHTGLLMDVPMAANRYLHNKRDITGAYPFSTYFTWYISERIGNDKHSKRES